MSLTHDGMDKFKVPQCKWDSKTAPHGWWVFSKAIAAMVRTSTKYRGELLEDFLDDKLKRPKIQKACIPSYTSWTTRTLRMMEIYMFPSVLVQLALA